MWNYLYSFYCIIFLWHRLQQSWWKKLVQSKFSYLFFSCIEVNGLPSPFSYSLMKLLGLPLINFHVSRISLTRWHCLHNIVPLMHLTDTSHISFLHLWADSGKTSVSSAIQHHSVVYLASQKQVSPPGILFAAGQNCRFCKRLSPKLQVSWVSHHR